MKKYKLLQWYPSLPKGWKLGHIFERKDGDRNYYHTVGRTFGIDACEVENNPDFWELIEDKKPLFITEDGMDITDIYSTIIVVDGYFTKSYWKVSKYLDGFNIQENKIFKHEPNADEYIWRNKRVFSYEDFIKWGNAPYQRVIEQLAKERI